MHGWMDGWTNRRIDRWTDGQICRWTNGPIDRWTDGRIDTIITRRIVTLQVEPDLDGAEGEGKDLKDLLSMTQTLLILL